LRNVPAAIAFIFISLCYSKEKINLTDAIKKKINAYGFAEMNDSTKFETQIKFDLNNQCRVEIIDSGFVQEYSLKMSTEFDLRESDSLAITKSDGGNYAVVFRNKDNRKIFKRTSTSLKSNGEIFIPKKFVFETATAVSFADSIICATTFNLLKEFQKECKTGDK
jgi:hypothetical protein